VSALTVLRSLPLRCSYEHPYLLADNRHYPFYLWRRCFRGHPLSLRYVLAPVYVVGALLLSTLLRRSIREGGGERSWLWVLLFWVATGAVLVPASLLEFRYFTVPFYLLVLQLTSVSDRALLTRTLAYTSVSALSIAVFLVPRADGERFMW
jgi:alpha-1,2-glucosyltransferase